MGNQVICLYEFLQIALQLTGLSGLLNQDFLYFMCRVYNLTFMVLFEIILRRYIQQHSLVLRDFIIMSLDRKVNEKQDKYWQWIKIHNCV